ncbi:MAG: hypothetical protein JEZ09_04315 [Salinivirgaceae bacterium]|nr:hypothetical protein [Salinivirgaceae bacterium]
MNLNHHSSSRISERNKEDIIRFINLKLASMGQPIFESSVDGNEKEFINLSESLLNNYKEKMRLLSNTITNPSDQRIQDFINRYLKDIEFDKSLNLPYDTFVLDKPGIGREVSLPPDKNEYINKYVSSYRIKQGVLHNPIHDRRTTSGSFHIVKGGLPIPPDKKAVPKIAFAHLLHAALNPPAEMLTLPFTGSMIKPAQIFTSLLLRPTVCPEVAGITEKKSMEVRFFAPGLFVSNLDFVESIFGNAGDPHLAQNDAALDIKHWTGHTGCVILAPQLTQLKKKEIGLPHFEDATERQRKDGMCWKHKDELYNEGSAFKISCRDESGVIITLIADNYFGYSKKEIKTQISYSANMFGLAEEEHSGGTLAFVRRNLGDAFDGEKLSKNLGTTYKFADVVKEYGQMMHLMPENYGVDKNHENLIYIPEDAKINLYESSITWKHNKQTQQIKLLRDHYYVLPSGYKVHMEKHPFAPEWRLILTYAEGTFLHKPSTVSGGGKSEISKSLLNAIIYSNFFIDDIEKDFAMIDEILTYDFSKRWKEPTLDNHTSRHLLSNERSLGSVIKLLTPFEGHTQAYNKYVNSIPDYVKGIIFLLKKLSQNIELKDDWKKYFTIDKINGRPGHSLMLNSRKISKSFLRVGFTQDNSWYVHSLRPDFVAAAKIQMEDDISATITVPAKQLEYLNPKYENKSVKMVENCEYRFFQRPDEAVNRGYDKEAESDLSKQNTFTTNYQPLSVADGKEMVENAITFDQYTDPIKRIIKKGAKDKTGNYFISPSHTRIIADGSRSKNPRYLQERPDFSNPIDNYLAKVGTRFFRQVPADKPVHYPVNNVLPGRRNNPSDKAKGIRPLSVYNPIHYQEMPELFMDYISSLTGKSPSTTGAGSEGALTKGPFNMLVPTTDLNNALLSSILTGYEAFSTAAGHVGPNNRFDHDISILIPELWCRLTNEQKKAKNMIANGSIEKLEDFEYQGQKVLASRLGYRITKTFVFNHFGRIFEEPSMVFTNEMLKPELQSMEDFVDGINNIVEAQQKSALQYFEDGSIESAIPPLKILLHIMAYGHYENKDLANAELREIFKRENVLQSPWYKERLKNKQQKDIILWKKHVNYISQFNTQAMNASIVMNLKLKDQLSYAKEKLKEVQSQQYVEKLVGTIGADLIFKN